MNPLSIYATFTEQTCGEACWHAREDICRCSCGGQNHGCLRTPNGEQPARTCRIDGMRYTLTAVGPRSQMEAAANLVCDQAGPATTPRASRYADGSVGHIYVQWHDSRTKGAPARFKIATASQRAKWSELANYTVTDEDEELGLLWLREGYEAPANEMGYDKWYALGRHLWLREQGLWWSQEYPDTAAEGVQALALHDAGRTVPTAPETRAARLAAMKQESWYTG